MKRIKRLVTCVLVFILLITSTNFSYAETNQEDSDPIEWDEEIIYFIMTDRFFDGDQSNNDPYNIEGSYDPDHLEAYHGGDFRGIIEKIDYLKDLGVTTVWITPIVKNIQANMMESSGGKQYGYHGYWAEDFTQIDPHLGNEDDLKELIDLLAENDIKLMVDVVLNHPGYGMENNPTFEGMIRENPGGGDQTISLSGLPDFVTEEEDVREKLIKWQSDWLNNLTTEKGNTIDYFRVDTVKHVDHQTWIEFNSRLTSIDPDFKMIGENFGANIFNDGGYLNNQEMDSLLDFDFKEIAKDYAQGRVDQAEEALVRRNENISQERQMGQFLSSHDEHGFLAMKLGGNIDQFLVAVSLQLTSKGQPVIYSGEEIGMSGQRDNFERGIFSENRKSFEWEKVEDNNILDHYKKMIDIRNDYSEVLSKGDRQILHVDENSSVVSRTFEDETMIIGLNSSDQPMTIQVESQGLEEDLIDLYGGQKVSNDQGEMEITIPANFDGGTFIGAVESNVDSVGLYSNYYIFFISIIILLAFAFLFYKFKKAKK